MKIQVSLRTLAVVGAVLASLSFVGAAHAAQADLTLSPGASGCLDASGSSTATQVNAFGFVNFPNTSTLATFRLRNVTKAQLIAGPDVAQQVSYNKPANAPTDLYRICANNNVAGQTIKVTLIINVF